MKQSNRLLVTPALQFVLAEDGRSSQCNHVLAGRRYEKGGSLPLEPLNQNGCEGVDGCVNETIASLVA